MILNPASDHGRVGAGWQGNMLLGLGSPWNSEQSVSFPFVLVGEGVDRVSICRLGRTQGLGFRCHSHQPWAPDLSRVRRAA